ncbi:hypothetical protein SRHO_G00106630 [Serrasalmus rhombeus]
MPEKEGDHNKETWERKQTSNGTELVIAKASSHETAFQRKKHRGMECSMTSVISATLIMCLAFTGLDGAKNLPCDRPTFDIEVYNHCIPLYKQRMATSNYQQECPWPTTKGLYVQLDECVRKAMNLTFCGEPSLKNEIFLKLHQTYFPLCFFMQDPGLHVLLLLTVDPLSKPSRKWEGSTPLTFVKSDCRDAVHHYSSGKINTVMLNSWTNYTS